MTSRPALAASPESSAIRWAPALGMAMTSASASKVRATSAMWDRSPLTGTPLMRRCCL